MLSFMDAFLLVPKNAESTEKNKSCSVLSAFLECMFCLRVYNTQSVTSIRRSWDDEGTISSRLLSNRVGQLGGRGAFERHRDSIRDNGAG